MSRSAAKGPPARKSRALSSEVEVDREGLAVALRLAIGKDGLAIELARGVALGCLDIVELAVRLPNVRFPFDVTGGVAKFRNKRGELERISIELDARRFARWAEPKLNGLISPGPCTITVSPRAFGATVTIVAGAVLAFEVALVGGHDIALVVHGARGAKLSQPATMLAIRAVATLLGDNAEREGARFLVPRAAERLGRALLPDAGVRAPGGIDVALTGCGENDGVLFAAFTRRGTPSQLPPAATLANEAAMITRAADDARFASDWERARHLDVAALERAPRHPEIARRIAEVDAHVGSRAEAAIATLRASERTAYLGTLFGDLLLETGDRAGAIAALLREGERDASAPIAALAYARAAALASDPKDALAWLDAAVGRAPQLAELRWERGTRRLVQGRIADARADFQDLEALATGARDRHDVLRRAADIHRAHGLGADAAVLYERALLYRPDDSIAIAGLGAAIAAEGRAARGATLLGRAIEIAEAESLPTAWIELELARVLAEKLADRPAAVAHLRAIPDEAPEAIEARGLEGRYRAALGDAAGASLAFARLRERAGREMSAIPWLEEAAKFEESRGELALAQAHLAAALAITPASTDIEAHYRALGDKVARSAGIREIRIVERPEDKDFARERVTMVAPQDMQPIRERITVVAPPEGPTARERTTLAAPPSEAVSPVPTEAEDEARVEMLTKQLQGDPNNDAIVDELTERLTRLGRSMELFALLSARLEESPPERRAELLPQHRAVLERLENEARAAGRDGEAELFKMARETVGE